jgi:hypothetical protein
VLLAAAGGVVAAWDVRFVAGWARVVEVWILT